MSLSQLQDIVMAERRRSQQVVQLTMAALSLGSLVFGLGVYFLSHRIGIAQETARIIATAFLAIAILDALVLYVWERIFKL